MAKRTVCLCLVFVVCIFNISLFAETESDRTETGYGLSPILHITDINVGEVKLGEDFYITLEVKNIGNGPAYNLRFENTLRGKSHTGPFTLKSGPKIDEFFTHQTKTITLHLSIDEEATTLEDYELEIKLQYTNVQNVPQATAHSFVKVRASRGNIEPDFLIEDIVINEGDKNIPNSFTASINYKNIGQINAQNVSALIDGLDNFEILNISNRKYLGTVDGGKSGSIQYLLKSRDEGDSNKINLVFTFDYEPNKSKSQDISLNLPVKRNPDTVGKTPWLIISKYVLSPEKILAGNTVLLKLNIENTSSKEIHNAKVSIVDVASGDAIVDTVFSPVNSSNTFYIEKIPGKSTHTHEVALYVDPNAQAKTYNVPIEIKYEYEGSDTELEAKERVNIPVTQESKLEILSVEVPPMAMIGQPIPIAAEFVNVGKVALTNF
ncbi:MAG: hypothetical protein GYA02_16900, partial [Clostridiaceae bacterium]|nr:hypothetical protein [Clostridiaceae bacterium]